MTFSNSFLALPWQRPTWNIVLAIGGLIPLLIIAIALKAGRESG